MGLEVEHFVHPERISSQLICPICTNVLENPIQTPSEHLYCEDCILEWLTHSNVCPVTKSIIDPNSIRKPGRIITNMLSELNRYCPHKPEGCEWVGENCQASLHSKTCRWRPRDMLLNELESKSKQIEHYRDLLAQADENLRSFEIKTQELLNQVAFYERKLKVYDAFIQHDDKEQCGESALQKIAKLRLLQSFDDDSK